MMTKAMKNAHGNDGKGEGGASVVMARESVGTMTKKKE